MLKNLIINEGIKEASLKVKILQPARQLFATYLDDYHAMIFNDKGNWLFAEENNNLKFEWSLIKYDLDGNFVSIKELGYKPTLTLVIPENYDLYRLQLTVIDGDVSKSHITTLNTPYVLK